MTFLGLDPGASGGIAAIVECETFLTPMPESLSEILELIYFYGSAGAIAVLEQVSGWTGGNFKKDGEEGKHGGAPGSHMFVFGKSVGRLEMGLVAAGFTEGETFHRVIPYTWQKAVGAPAKQKHQTKQQHKGTLNRFAKEMFPQVRGITLRTADALLMAVYCRMKYGQATETLS